MYLLNLFKFKYDHNNCLQIVVVKKLTGRDTSEKLKKKTITMDGVISKTKFPSSKILGIFVGGTQLIIIT